MLKPIVLSIALVTAASVTAQKLPDAPTPHLTNLRVPRTDLFLLGADAVTRGLDTFSTYRAVQNPNIKEANMGQYMAHHPWLDGMYSGGVVVGEYFIVRELERRHHHRLAELVPSIDIVYDGSCVVNNFGQPQLKPGQIRRAK